ncbi:MAG: hypothetical protein AB7P03_20670 [Kofleriaceae bacterium]
MRTRSVIAGLVLAASSAVAQPQQAPEVALRCDVTVLFAPDDVRPVIEGWVRAEPSCTNGLSVRVFEVDGGLYVLARASNGRVYERVVPDAQTAGVLIASWAADDMVTVPQPSPPTLAPSTPPVTPAVVRRSAAPGMVAPTRSDVDAARTSSAAAKTRSITAGWMTQLNGEGFGGRLDVDLFAHRGWRFGAGAIASQHAGATCGDARCEHVELTETRVLVHVGRAIGAGLVQFRLSAAAGITKTGARAISVEQDAMLSGDGVFATLEARALTSVALGSSWAVVAGPIVTQVMQKLVTPSAGSFMPQAAATREPDVTIFVGMMYLP